MVVEIFRVLQGSWSLVL